MPEKVPPSDKQAKSEQITEYYRNLPTDGPVPEDETKTHMFNQLIEKPDNPDKDTE